METLTENQLSKKQSFAFGKNVYLLGVDNDGLKYWLESPSWDCSWYWGFGYVENYTNNNNPAAARDINSHQHLDGDVLNEISSFTMNGVELAIFKQLVTEFYSLRKEADAAHQTKPNIWFEINSKLLPNLMTKILNLLAPDGKTDGTFRIPTNEELSNDRYYSKYINA